MEICDNKLGVSFLVCVDDVDVRIISVPFHAVFSIWRLNQFRPLFVRLIHILHITEVHICQKHSSLLNIAFFP